MKLVRQPKGSNLCGHACVAMLCGITLAAVRKVLLVNGKTETKHLWAALRHFGITAARRRVRGMPKEGTALLFWRHGEGAHWTVWHKNKHYDPAAGVFRKVPEHLSEARVTSHLKVTL